MGIENPVHLLFIAAVALIVLGPKRLPEVAKALGHGIREFREAVSNPDLARSSHQPHVPPPTAPSEAPAAPHAVDSAPTGRQSSTGQRS
jgi:sec-independent protein translocase protein TatA